METQVSPMCWSSKKPNQPFQWIPLMMKSLSVYRRMSPMREWISLYTMIWSRPKVFGHLIYPERSTKKNIERDIHHFLRQVFQRCPRLDRRQPQPRRIFVKEVKEYETPHAHFVMETPDGMSPQEFRRLCVRIWEKIALRDRRHVRETRRWRTGCLDYQPTSRKPVLIKNGVFPKDTFTKTPKRYPETCVYPSDRDLAKVVLVDSIVGAVEYCMKWTERTDGDYIGEVMFNDDNAFPGGYHVRGYSTSKVILKD